MPVATRDMLVSNASEGAEDFWPTITQTSDGKIYITTLLSCIVRVEGLETVKRLPTSSLSVTPQMLLAAQAYFVQVESERQTAKVSGTLQVALRSVPPVIDGKLDDWADAKWVTIDIRTDQHGDWGHSEAKNEAALAVSGGNLVAAFRTGEPKLATNAGGDLPLFKTGGGLDILLGDGTRAERLLVARVAGKTKAILYRPHDLGAVGQPTSFSSPLRTIRSFLIR